MSTSRTAALAPDEESDLEDEVETPDTLADEPEQPEDAEEPAEQAAPAPEEELPAQAGDTAEPAESESAADAASREAQPTADEEPDDAESVQAEPFRFRVDGVEVAPPDAVRTPYGIVISPETWERHIQPKLADRDAIRARELQHRQKIRELETTRSAADVKAQAQIEEIDRLLSDEDAMREFFSDFDRNAELLKLRIENKTLTAQHAVPAEGQNATEADQLDVEAQVRDLREILPGALERAVGAVLAEGDFKDLGQDANELHATLWQLAQQGAPVFGVDPQQGYVVNLEYIRTHLKPAVRAVARTRTALTTQQAVKQHNARALPEQRRPAPQVVGGKSSPAATTNAIPAFKTQEEYQRWLFRKED